MKKRMALGIIAGGVVALAAAGVGVAGAVTTAAPTISAARASSISGDSATITWKTTGAAGRVRVLAYNASTGVKAADVTVTAGKAVITLPQGGTAYGVELHAASIPGWTAATLLFTQAPAGPRGVAGPPGAQGPSGVVSAGAHDLGAVDSVATGGSFVANATLAGTVTLDAGTYLISLDAKATPDEATSAQVFPQFFVYDEAASQSFAGNLFNVGAGALEPFGTDVAHSHDSYYSGADLVTLPSDVTLDIYAFGYDSDNGGATYRLDDLTVSAVQVKADS
jgi:hypothetical protein